jgi:outer membrane protein OmpA-like peptidoglycan-associated protein
MEEIPVRRKRSLWWLLPLTVIGLVVLFLIVRANRSSEPTGETRTTGAPVAPPAEVARACTNDLSCSDQELCIGGGCRPIAESTTECNTVTVHFPTGVSTLSGSDDRDVERLAHCLKANQKTKATIEGSADPRPASRGNDVLARERADALKDALKQRGVADDQLEAIGRGQDDTACAPGDQDCLARKRRATGTVTP